MFTAKERDHAREVILRIAHEDQRTVAGAVVGSLARGNADRWSDLDLTFAVADDVPVGDVLDDWTPELQTTLDAVPVWSGEVRGRTYRVFLLPGWLQVDLSFAPASEFRPAGPAFALHFGEAGPVDVPAPPTTAHFSRWGVLQAVHARRCIERERYWQAEYMIERVRECALSVTCLQHGLDPSHGRGFDDLPSSILQTFPRTLARSLERQELLRALGHVVDTLVEHSVEARSLPSEVITDLRSLATAQP